MGVGKASERMDLSAPMHKPEIKKSVLSKPDQTIFTALVVACNSLASRRPVPTMEVKALLNWGLTNTPLK